MNATSSEGVNANTRVVCPLEIKAVEFNREVCECDGVHLLESEVYVY